MRNRSFESINYSLRPNKNVERKLIVSSINKLQGIFPIDTYRYVGFGSMWFADFVLMHKHVGITDMVTIEIEHSRSKRVEFNKPFACINVRMEAAATALGEVLDDKNTIVWLDYDGSLKDAMTGDIETAIGSMTSGSLILVSVNANVKQLEGQQSNDEVMTPIKYLAEICDSTSILSQQNRLSVNDFPEFVAEILHDKIKGSVLSKKPGCTYIPIWTFSYSDGVKMITVGGMIANTSDENKLTSSGIFSLPYISGLKTYKLSIPVLTEKEKRALDKLLPSVSPLNQKHFDFELRDNEIEAYQKFYIQYPVFNETTI